MRILKLSTLFLLAGSMVFAGASKKVPVTMTSEEVEGYFSGAGMGQGQPAETFGYPGPKHVLELEKELELTPEQKYRVEAFFKKMGTEAVYFGKRLVVEELALDEFFRSGQTNLDALGNRLERIGGWKWKLRQAHLVAHVKTKLVLTPEQIKKYQELRSDSTSAGKK